MYICTTVHISLYTSIYTLIYTIIYTKFINSICTYTYNSIQNKFPFSSKVSKRNMKAPVGSARSTGSNPFHHSRLWREYPRWVGVREGGLSNQPLPPLLDPHHRGIKEFIESPIW